MGNNGNDKYWYRCWFFDQRLTLTADYYVRKTKDILLNIPISVVTGLKAPIQNIGNVEIAVGIFR